MRGRFPVASVGSGRIDAMMRGAANASRRMRAAAALLAVLTTVAVGGCRGTAAPDIRDPTVTAPALDPPDWFPRPFSPPRGGTLIDILAEPEPGSGRALTWRYDRSFDAIAKDVEQTLASLSWVPTEVAETEGDAGARRKSYFVENEVVFVIRLFSGEGIEGVRLSVELPA